MKTLPAITWRSEQAVWIWESTYKCFDAAFRGKCSVQHTRTTRVFYTHVGKRIDLVLELDQDIVIAIGNKIHAGLYILLMNTITH